MSIDIAMQGTRVIGGIAPRLRGGAGNPPAPPQGVIQTFTLENTEVSSTPLRFKGGMVFKKGDIPSGSVPKVSVQGGAEVTQIQFDRRSTWSDGSLKRCECRFVDTDLAGSASRTYEIEAKSAFYDNTERIAIATIETAALINILITNLTDVTSASTVGSGTFEAAFNDTTVVHRTKIGGGAAAEIWQVAIFVTDQTGGAADAHLKARFTVEAWNDGTDAVADYSFGVVMSMDGWDVAGKDRRTYNLSLRDNTTEIRAYNAVNHPYHCQLATPRMADDDQHGKMHWGTTTPTLLYKPDFKAWMDAGLIPPYDLNVSPIGGANDNTYLPGDNFDHNSFVDQGGGSLGRGIVPNCDIHTIVDTTSVHARLSRVQAFAGLHIGYHYREEGTDKPMSAIMDPLNSVDYDFTNDGLSGAKHAYNRAGEGSANSGGWKDPDGGDGVWTKADNASHAVNYCYFTALYEAEDWFYEAQIDLMTNLIHSAHGNEFDGMPYLMYYSDTYRRSQQSIPNIRWSAIGNLLNGSNVRAIGWSQAIMASTCALVGDADYRSAYLNKLNEHNASFLKASMGYFPQSQLDLGIPYYSNSRPCPWMWYFSAMGCYHNSRCNELTDAFDYGEITAQALYNVWTSDRKGMVMDYRGGVTPKSEAWHSVDNDFFTDHFMWQMSDATITNGSANISMSPSNLIEYSNGDTVWFLSRNSAPTLRTIPSVITEGDTYYVVNKGASGDPYTFQVSSTPGGSPITFTENATIALTGNPSELNITKMQSPGYVAYADHQANQARFLTVLAYEAGSNIITASEVTTALTFVEDISTKVNEDLHWRAVDMGRQP